MRKGASRASSVFEFHPQQDAKKLVLRPKTDVFIRSVLFQKTATFLYRILRFKETPPLLRAVQRYAQHTSCFAKSVR
jgi:hypothetical protein